MKFTIDALSDTTSELRHHYAKGDDGKFYLQVEDHPDTTRLAEFRDNNRSLNTLKTDLEAKLKAFDGIDAAAARAALAKLEAGDPDAAAKVAAAEAQLTAEKQAHDATRFAHLVGSAFLATQGQPTASAFIVEQARSVFQMQDGKLVSTAFSTAKPGEKLDVTEWLSSQMNGSLAYCWKPSKGGGANPAPGAPAPKRVINGADALEVGRNLEQIARGEVTVQ